MCNVQETNRGTSKYMYPTYLEPLRRTDVFPQRPVHPLRDLGHVQRIIAAAPVRTTAPRRVEGGVGGIAVGILAAVAAPLRLRLVPLKDLSDDSDAPHDPLRGPRRPLDHEPVVAERDRGARGGVLRVVQVQIYVEGDARLAALCK